MNRIKKQIVLIAILVFGIIALSYEMSIGAGDGNLLKRSQEVTCHACHKTEKNRASTDADWDEAIKTHSSAVLGSCSNITYKTQQECVDNAGTWTHGRWGVNGWGVSGGKYGEFVCTTCHSAHDTSNIYLIAETINTPDSSNFEGRTTGSVAVDFRFLEAYDTGNPKEGTMGRDDEVRTSSNRICEVCHTFDAGKTNGVNQHAYSMGSAVSHNGATACLECHSHKAAFKGEGECITCHDTGGSGTTGPNNRRAIVPEFNQTWSHKRTASGTVTNEDCAVCHLEGASGTNPSLTALHDNGVIDLRNPDTGDGTGLTAFADFTRNTNSSSLESWVTNVQSNLCLKCHDSDGAVHASARVTGGTDLRPFATAPSHTPSNNVLDVDSDFDTANATYHPVKGAQNNSYADQDTMEAPWNQFSKTAGTPTDGDVISCWDCHPALNTAHGGTATLRAGLPAYASSPTSTNRVDVSSGTLCSLCHKDTAYVTNGASQHSAFGGNPYDSAAQHGKDGKMDFTCTHCHGGYWADPGRPQRAQDVHGFDAMTGGSATWPADGSRPYAFLRNDKPRGSGTNGQFSKWRPRRDGATTNGSWGCAWVNSGGSGACNRNDHTTSYMSYTPGGAF